MSWRADSGLNVTVQDDARDGPVFVLLHPVGLCGDFWASVRAAFAPYAVATVDLPGHGGLPDPGESFSLDRIADDVAASAVRLGRPTVLVGCSLGGIIAQLAAIRAPDLCAGLVLANTLCRSPNSEAIEARAQFAVDDFSAYVDHSQERWFNDDFRAAHPDAVGQVRRWLMATAPAVHARYWRAMARFDLTAALASVAAKTLVIAGEFDRSVPPQAARDIAAAVPYAQLEIMKGAGHLAPFEQPQVFSKLVMRKFANFQFSK